jgi:cytochrome P450
VFRHADLRAFGACAEAANAPPAIVFPRAFDRGRAERAPEAAIARVISNQVFTANPPIHGPIRRMLLSELGPRPTTELEPAAVRIARKLLERLPNDGELDFVGEVAEPLAVRFWAEVLGMTDAETASLATCVKGMTALFQLRKSRADIDRADHAFAAYEALVEGAALRSFEMGAGHPMIAAMAAELAKLSFDDDPAESGIVPRNVGALLAGNLVDGVHTAGLGVANAVFVLALHSEALESLRGSPELIAQAVAEALRVEPPVLFLSRHVFRPFDYDGLEIPGGTPITMLWAAGDHDPAVFPDPGRFDLRRPHQGLTTFGGGIHICPGRFVAQMLARVTVRCVIEMEIELTPSRAATWIEGHMMGQLAELPLQIRRGSRAARGGAIWSPG